jgi:heme-degrading monooxygenase HmoA
MVPRQRSRRIVLRRIARCQRVGRAIVQLPWQEITKPDADREYLALLTFLPLKGFRGTFALIRRDREVAAQLHDTPGVIGFSFRALLLRHRFWTLSAWEDEESLMAFVGKPPHRDAMEALGPHMAETSFTRWKVPGSEIPLNWDRALAHTSKEP